MTSDGRMEGWKSQKHNTPLCRCIKIEQDIGAIPIYIRDFSPMHDPSVINNNCGISVGGLLPPPGSTPDPKHLWYKFLDGILTSLTEISLFSHLILLL